MKTWKYKMVAGKLTKVNVTPRPFTSTYITEGLQQRYDTLQERLIIYCKANGLSQAEFTKYMQMAAWRERLTRKKNWVSFSPSGTSAWMRGICSPSEGRESLICKYTGLPKEWLRGFVPVDSVNYTDHTTQIWQMRDMNQAA